ncbi:hypothetical protein QTI33_33290 [Variovorax sp. J22P271]|uniref:hypothetical protein n=1 Tax=Variovorax davisae TaxID=3053515 RepID=UPI002574A4D9|nr:hypothetical protein [Variovorax sp. J22P271]MDM0037050.1 hypothetical protein [Variovorax sp. J22P271]
MPNLTVGKTTQNATTTVDISATKASTSEFKVGDATGHGTLKVIYKEFESSVEQLQHALAQLQASPDRRTAALAEEAGKVVVAAARATPERPWYSISVKGLLEAARAVGDGVSPLVSAALKVAELVVKADKAHKP